MGALATALALPVSATPPNLAFSPGADVDGVPDGGSQTPSLEVQFSGATTQVSVTPSGGVSDPPADQTVITCSISGDPAITLSSSTRVLVFVGSTTTPQTLDLACTAGSETRLAVLSCNQKKGGVSSGTIVFDVACPVAGQPEYVSSPAAGTTLSIVADFPASATATLSVTNTGAVPLNISSVAGLSPPLSIMPANAMIGGGASQDFTVTCNPSSPGTFLGNFVVSTNDADEPSNNHGVDCNIRSAEFAAMPAPPGPIALATTQGANTSASITVNNAGNAPLVLGALTGLSGRLSASQFPAAAIAPGQNATLTVSCDATTTGSASQSLSFTTNDTDDNEGSIAYDVACTVNAAPAPEFSSTPAAPGPFNLVTGQGTNVSAPLTLQNVGSAPLTLSLSTPPAAPVTVTGISSPVAPGGSVLLSVNCDATSAGNFVRSFALGTNDSDEPTVTYSVNCNVGAPPPPEFDSVPAAPGPLAISTFQGTNGSTALLLRNTGNTTLNFAMGALPVPFGLSPPMAGTLAPGASQNYTLTCTATNTGFFTGTLTVSTNDPNESSVNFDLQCRVQPNAPEFASAPASGSSLAISTVAGESSSGFIFLTNQGSLPLNLNVAPPLPPLSTSFASAVLAPGENRALRVICLSADRVSTFQNVTIATNDSDENPVNYLVTCNVAGNARSAFRQLLGAGTFTRQVSERILKDSFE